MELLAAEHGGAEVLWLARRDVVRCCADLDVVAITEDTLKAHADGDTVVPAEAYLGWQTAGGHSARSLAMPGAITGGGRQRLGLKVINASLGNISRGLPRSQGFTMIFAPETARPVVIMEAAYISSLRTAAVTAVTARRLGRTTLDTLALIGCGTVARAHLAVVPGAVPTMRRVQLYDVEQSRAEALAAALRADGSTAHLEVVVAGGPRECVRGAGLVIPLTTVTDGYLPYEWLEPGALVAHVSLDDVLPDVVEQAGLVLVDDWGLVSHDERRLLGRMYRAGRLLGPNGERCPTAPTDGPARRVDGTLGEVLLGARPGRRSDDDVILSNPFGMSVLDIAIGSAVHEAAVADGLGTRVPI